jgi:hypothetical protein
MKKLEKLVAHASAKSMPWAVLGRYEDPDDVIFVLVDMLKLIQCEWIKGSEE